MRTRPVENLVLVASPARRWRWRARALLTWAATPVASAALVVLARALGVG